MKSEYQFHEEIANIAQRMLCINHLLEKEALTQEQEKRLVKSNKRLVNSVSDLVDEGFLMGERRKEEKISPDTVFWSNRVNAGVCLLVGLIIGLILGAGIIIVQDLESAVYKGEYYKTIPIERAK